MVEEVKVEKDSKKTMKEKIVELEKQYVDKKAETKLILEQTREAIAKQQLDMREQLDQRQREINYYQHFMTYEKVEI